MRSRRLARAGEAAVRTYSRESCGQRAAAISYHVLFSLVPFAALLVSVLELVLPETAQEGVTAWLVESFPLPGEVADSTERAIDGAGPPASAAGAVALVTLAWTASGMMASVRSAFRAVWGSAAPRPYLRGKLLDAALLLGAGILVVCAFGLSIGAKVVTEAGTEIARELGGEGSGAGALGKLTELAGSLALALLAFLLLYRVAPSVSVRVRDAFPGAVVAAIGFHLASAGFALYLEYIADFDDVYGPLGAVLAFLLLVYVAAVVLLLGAAVAAAWPETKQPAAPAAHDPIPMPRRIARALRGLVTRDDAR